MYRENAWRDIITYTVNSRGGFTEFTVETTTPVKEKTRKNMYIGQQRKRTNVSIHCFVLFIFEVG